MDKDILKGYLASLESLLNGNIENLEVKKVTDTRSKKELYFLGNDSVIRLVSVTMKEARINDGRLHNIINRHKYSSPDQITAGLARLVYKAKEKLENQD